MDEALQKRIDRLTGSPLFPFTGEFQLKEVSPLMEAELVRDGEGDKPCKACARTDGILWQNERWRITTIDPSNNPVGLFLETNDHIDFDDLDDEMAAEFGILSKHLVSAIDALPDVGRAHIHRWGDGSAHFHVWYQGRPARLLETYGWGNVLWPQLLEPVADEVLEANHAAILAAVAAAVARH